MRLERHRFGGELMGRNAGKRILFLLTQAPYSSTRALETLESVLVAGVFDQEVSVLFKGAGLYQLLDGQDGSAVGQRTVGKVVRALPEYDVEHLYVCRDSMERLGLRPADLCLPVEILDSSEQQDLIAGQHAVVSG